LARSKAALDVLVVGDYCLDLIFIGLAEFPRLGKEVVATDMVMTPGGSYNSAAALHRLGMKVGWATDFGDDEYSQHVLACARQEGLEETYFVHHRRPLRRVTVALSYPEDRAFVAYYDAGPRLLAAVRALPAAHARLVLIPGFYAGRLLGLGSRVLRGRGARLCMDANTNQPVGLEEGGVRKALRTLDVFIANAQEAREMTGEHDPERALRRLGLHCPLVVVKAGQEGSYAMARGTTHHQPAVRVKPVDTTGAGDAFNAGFLCAWLDGKPLDDCLRWGNVVGGLSTEGIGGTGRKVTRSEVLLHL
jgi:sugar/nucleoside kinase (ribokinase family)